VSWLTAPVREAMIAIEHKRRREMLLIIDEMTEVFNWPTVANDASDAGESVKNHGKVSDLSPEIPTAPRQ